MSATTISTISTLIKNKLSGITVGANPAFKKVYEYPTGTFEGYPSAVIIPTGGTEGKVIDTHRNERTFSFKVSCYQAQTQQGLDKEDAYTRLRDVCDAVIIAFDQEKDFNHEVLEVKVVKMSFEFRGTDGVHNFATFDVDVRCIVQNGH